MKASFFFFLSGLFISCASYKTQYTKESAKWEQSSPSPSLVLQHTMYLVGDGGNAYADKTPVLDYLKTTLASESKNSSILFLGDNIYEYGMPPKEDEPSRKAAEFNITAQLTTLDNFKGRPIFLPGNHDWRGWGLKGLKRQENFIESYLNNRNGKTDKESWENYFLPDDGCSGPEAVELSNDVVVLVVDSQWWLADWDKEPKINEGCEARNRASFRFIFENMVRKYRNKSLVIAMHHPVYTYGPHGGGFTPKQHLFPLTDINPKLWIPLPGIGTLEAVVRSSIGSRQDVANQNYKELTKSILAAAKKNGSFIFASGHEHTLQYIENENQKFIVSGSGAKVSPVRLGKGSEFASPAKGYSTIRFYEGGEAWTQFWEVDDDGKSARVIFQKKLKDAALQTDSASAFDFSEYDKHLDTILQSVTTTEVKPVNKAHEFFFGSHHRNVYLEKYPFPIFDAATFQGGVTPLKQGGGNQTNSLRVKAANGKDFVLRGMTKDASRFLPFPFNKMVAAKYLVEDHFLSTHPFAPLVVPSLADAIQVYHTNPQIYYVPAQPALGSYNSIFGGTLCLVEERPGGKNWKDAPFFGSPDNIISTPDLVENILKNNNHKVDEPWALRSRLFDFIIGDWDRHDDQWTWARFDGENDLKTYRPIPRDRDQAFSRYDGFIAGVANQTLPFLRQLQTYGPEIKNEKWTTWSARLFDRTFLNELDWPQWEAQVKIVQQQLTDEIIEKAFLQWPDKAREFSAPSIINSIKARRDNLLNIARIHYDFVSESVNVIGTDERERFEVTRMDDKHTHVVVHELSKKGEKKQVVYERTFTNQITKTINLYGNGDDDEFIVTGYVGKGLRVRLIGGIGNDVFTDESFVENGLRKTIVYDDLQKNKVTPGRETKDKRTNIYSYNIYDRRGYDSEYDIVLPTPILGFNPDDGALVGGQLNFINHSFKKEPYASSQIVSASYAFETNAFKVSYRADLLNVFRKSDFYLDTRYHGPTYAFNFANLGNTTVRDVDDANFYRVRQESFRIYTAFKKRFANNSGWITLGPAFETNKIENTPGRFINTYGSTEDPKIFNRRYFYGAELGLNYNNVDNYFTPHRGIRFQSSLSRISSLHAKTFTSWRAHLSFYKHLDTKENFVLASQIGGGGNIGSGYEFFQLPTIGGSLGLRGYRTERFYGQKVFWHSTDLRARLVSNYNPVLPITIGVFGSFDYGRAWLKGESSDKWHNSFGGGLWFAPVDALLFSFGTFFPSEDYEESPRFVFRLGFGF
jgi:hypothetical protein